MKMIKIIMITLTICCLVVSCGKKGDPKYNETTKIRIEINYI